MVTTGPGKAEQVRELPVDADTVILRRRSREARWRPRAPSSPAVLPRPRPSTGARASTRRACSASAALDAHDVAHVLPFVLAGAVLVWLEPLSAPVALVCLAHAWSSRSSTRRAVANVMRPPGGADARASTALGLLGDLVGTPSATCTPDGLVVEPGRLGTWRRRRVGRAARALGRAARRLLVHRRPDPEPALADRIAHLLLALRTDEQGFATVANLRVLRPRGGACGARLPAGCARRWTRLRAVGRTVQRSPVTVPPGPYVDVAHSASFRAMTASSRSRLVLLQAAALPTASPNAGPQAAKIRATASRAPTCQAQRTQQLAVATEASATAPARVVARDILRACRQRSPAPRSSSSASRSSSSPSRAWLLLKFAIGFVAWLATVVVVIVAAIAVIWALRVLL
jgi:hypothetical protein